MSFPVFGPVFFRELRLARRRTGNWRTSWSWVGSTVVFCAFLVLFIGPLGGGLMFNSLQGLFWAGSALVALMPLGFVADRDAGQQSSLRLAGLGPLGVYAASVAGSLYVAMEAWLYSVPLLLVGFSFRRTPPAIALLLVMTLGLFGLWLASLRILGAAVARTRSGSALVALTAGACLGLTVALDAWLSPRLGSPVARILHELGGVEHWLAAQRAMRPPAQTTALWNVLARLLAWSTLWLAAAAWAFRRQWLRAESGRAVLPWYQRWLKSGLNTPARAEKPEAFGPNLAYRARYPRPDGWLRLKWALAAALAIGGVGAAWVWSWQALPVALTVAVAAVDMMAHVAVSGAVADDRREGTFELLLTTPLRPGEIMSAADQTGREVVRNALFPGLGLLMVLGGALIWLIQPANHLSAGEWLVMISYCAWPLVYATGLRHLSFRLPASQAANTAETFHAFSLPLTAWIMPILVGLGAWAFTAGDATIQNATAVGGLVVIVIWLIVRERFSSEYELSDDDFRLVAVAPLPTEQVIPKDRRTTTPWVPEGFRR